MAKCYNCKFYFTVLLANRGGSNLWIDPSQRIKRPE
ncbi:protein of unknown function [Magnetospirillum gryphiswaldense MSR-1 v2]|uniref:Uncharacterized protein n=1 Tax=Magnetospirillum gryphiswaldense (strain DSM 6361 / JCM 21280 / NBRC 15271 / MSR-1) TaxID=431944 RepID=V6F8C0_MAGGM|nr:protein of unknown function [Magnetospirillum gryphiswaldense MSR-1 v2]